MRRRGDAALLDDVVDELRSVLRRGQTQAVHASDGERGWSETRRMCPDLSVFWIRSRRPAGAGAGWGHSRGVAHRVTSSRVSDMVAGERRAAALRPDPRARHASGLSGLKLLGADQS